MHHQTITVYRGSGLIKNDSCSFGVRWSTLPTHHGSRVWVGEILKNPITDSNLDNFETRGYVLIENSKVSDEKTIVNRIKRLIDSVILRSKDKNPTKIMVVPPYRRRYITVDNQAVMFLVVQPWGSKDFTNPEDDFEMVGAHYVKHLSSGKVYPLYIGAWAHNSFWYSAENVDKWSKSDRSVVL